MFFGVEVDQTPIDQTQQKVDNLLGTFRGGMRVVQAFGAALLANGMVQFISRTVAAADDIGDMAARLGIATDQFQVLKAVAEDAGTSVGAIQSAFRNLAANTRDGAKDFKALGVSIQDAGGAQKSTTQLFWEAGEAVGAIEDSNKRLALAQKIFGRSALDLIPIFTAEKGSLDELKEAAVVFSDEFIESADRVAKRQMILELRWQRIKAIITQQVLPAFEWLLDKTSRVAAAMSKFVQSGKAMQGVLALIGAAFVRFAILKNLGSLVGWLFRVGAASRVLMRALLRFALPVLVIDELITLFRGGDTLIGRFINRLFGVGKAAAMVELVTGAAKSLLDTLALIFNPSGVEDWELAFIQASEGIGRAFDAMFEGLFQVARDFGEFFSLVVGQAVDWVMGKIKSIPGVDTLLGSIASAPAGGSFGPGTGPLPSIAPPPSLAPAAQVRVSAGAPAPVAAPQVTNNITVGNATPAVAREIGQRAGAATSAALGRDRAAIGAAVGVTP